MGLADFLKIIFGTGVRCPKCGSTRVIPIKGVVEDMFKCLDCGNIFGRRS